MLNFLFILIMHLIPLILLLIPFLLLFDVSYKGSKKNLQKEKTPEINTKELEEKLNLLITNNQHQNNISNLQKELEKSSSKTISSYVSLGANHPKGFHLFQLIFSLIKNKSDDRKIIRILSHYYPTTSNSHLYAILQSYKTFLKISQNDNIQKQLIKDLNQNNVKTTLNYLEKKLHAKLIKLSTLPPSLQELAINEAVAYALTFASFSEFYDSKTTTKILNIANKLSPKIFKYWHTEPKLNHTFNTPKLPPIKTIQKK